MPHLVIGTAGHVDHGKSSLVHALTGIDPDRLDEEKRRGITIDLGFAHWVDGARTIAFVDVPGHERFVRNMLAGAGGIDAVMLVVAADRSVMSQTREHFEICRLLGVARGVVVITKADLADEDGVGLAAIEIAELVRGSFLADAPVVPVSVRTGSGLDSLRRELRHLADSTPRPPTEGAARLPIDRVFTMTGFGTVVTGTLVAGSIAVNDSLDVVPGGAKTTVRAVQIHGVSQGRAEAGQRVALNLADMDVADLSRGQVLSSPGALRATRAADVWVDVLQGDALEHGHRVRFHHGTAEALARVSVVGPATEAGEPPAIAGGASGPCRLRFETEVAVRRGDRFVLRACSPVATIAGGVVLDAGAVRGGVRSVASLERLQALHARPIATGLADAAAHARLVADAGDQGLPVDDLIWRAGVAPNELATVVQALEQGRGAVNAAGTLVSPGVIERARARVLAALAAHHEAQPLSDGLPRQEIRHGVLGTANADVADLVLQQLEDAGQTAGRDRVALTSKRRVFSEEALQVRDRIETALRAAGLTPPDVDQLTAIPNVPASVVKSVVQLMVREREVVSVGGLLYHTDALQTLRREVSALKTGGGEASVDVASFKSRYGLSRKYAIPLLEYLDRERVTRRVGERRIVL